MKNIYIIDESTSSKQNGIGTYIKELVSGMRGYAKTHIISFNSNHQFFKKEHTEVTTIYHIPCYCQGEFLNNPETALALLQLEIPDTKGNVFIVNHYPASKIIMGLKSHFPLSKIVFVIHGQSWATALMGNESLFRKLITNKRLNKIERSLSRQISVGFNEECNIYRLADAVVTLTKETTRLLTDIYNIPREKITEIPNGYHFIPVHFSKTKIRKSLCVEPTDKIILYAGRTTKLKGIDMILKSFNDVVIRHPEAKLVIAGLIFRLNEFANICPRGISRVVFTGLLTKERLTDWFHVADIGLMFSFYEQCSYTGIEMLAHGIPVIASDAIGVKTMFQELNHSPLVHISDNEEQMKNNTTNAICRLIESDKTTIQAIHDEELKHYKRKFSADSMVNKYISLITSF